MAYTPTTWETGDTITAASLNKLEQGVASASAASSSSSSGYDLIIRLKESVGAKTLNLITASDLEVVSGSILACEEKVANFQPVKGCCFLFEEYSWTNGNTNRVLTELELTYWHGPYCYIVFSGPVRWGAGSTTSSHVTAVVQYDYSTGAITTANVKTA